MTASSNVPELPTLVAPPEGKGLVQPADSDLPMEVGSHGVDHEGYTEIELFVSGLGDVYRYGETTNELVVAETAWPYTTRIIANFPKSRAQFSGTVLLEIADPEIGAGPLWPFTGDYLRRKGNSHVVVTTRRNNQAYGASTPISALKALDPLRYAPLLFEEGGLSWEILAQVAHSLRVGGPTSPLGTSMCAKWCVAVIPAPARTPSCT
jgi:hypothetical protein